jgi:hypothetical protein
MHSREGGCRDGTAGFSWHSTMHIYRLARSRRPSGGASGGAAGAKHALCGAVSPAGARHILSILPPFAFIPCPQDPVLLLCFPLPCSVGPPPAHSLTCALGRPYLEFRTLPARTFRPSPAGEGMGRVGAYRSTCRHAPTQPRLTAPLQVRRNSREWPPPHRPHRFSHDFTHARAHRCTKVDAGRTR